MRERIRAVPLFADLPDADLDRLAAGAEEVTVAPDEYLFHEGDFGDSAYIITAGELEILTVSGGREVLLAVRSTDEVIGEMALLRSEPRSASAKARDEVTTLRIPKADLDHVLETSPTATRALFRVLLERWQGTESRLRQSERMAQLGTLTAGLAHELNNPAAAVERSSGMVQEALADFLSGVAEAAAAGVDPAGLPDLMASGDGDAQPLSALDRSDAEMDVEDWLTDRNVPDAWNLAPDLVNEGVTLDMLEGLAATHGDAAGAAAQLLGKGRRLSGLISEIEIGASRLSAIVKALKGYAYLDQAPVQEIDLHDGLEDTLLILASKYKDIEVVREYGDVPRIEAYGSELNQVWTNLLDNAADALHETDGPYRVTIRTRVEGATAVVEVEDNGTGIPEEILPRVFDSFFTTKEPGKGTGLGLDISYGIVVDRHKGDLSVTSEPGRTTFRVELPCSVPAGMEEESMAMCEHLENVSWDPLPPNSGCEECNKIGGTWVHLRHCLTCGATLCCNDSPNQHAQKHADSTDHKTIRSAEPGEMWAWCYVHATGIQQQ
jgi:signal transduction histidine kinase